MYVICGLGPPSPIKNPSALGHIIFRIFPSQYHNSLVFAARQIANNLSPIAKKF